MSGQRHSTPLRARSSRHKAESVSNAEVFAREEWSGACQRQPEGDPDAYLLKAVSQHRV